MLAAVQHQQEPPRPEGTSQRIGQWPTRLLADTQHRRHPGNDELRLAQVGQLRQPAPIRIITSHPSQQPQREPGLADTPGTSQRQGTRHTQQPPQLTELSLAADEGIQLRRQLRLNPTFHIPDISTEIAVAATCRNP
jgi:hypothetical protein